MECCICKNPGKYKCPECSFRTCSLPCVKNHKFVYGCSGVSKPLKYIPVSNFTESNLRKDMNFLLDIARESDHSFKLVTKLSRTDNRKRFIFLINECRSAKIQLKIMPKSMSRHANNTSLFDKVEKVIIWRIEWKVIVGEKTGICCEVNGNRDDWTVGEVLRKGEKELKEVPKFVLEFGGQGVEGFEVYYVVGKILDQGEGRPVYERVDQGLRLREALIGLSSQEAVVEYPTFYISKGVLK